MGEMNRFEECLRAQMLAHPSMTAQDVVKLCYQAACGAEHLLEDLSGAKAYFQEEYALVQSTEEPLYEEISEHICRVNLGAWKREGLPSEQLFELFSNTVFQTDGKRRLTDYLGAAETVLRCMEFPMQEWHDYIAAYKEQGMPAVRHSVRYREAERPAYRIVSSAYVPCMGHENCMTET